MFVGSGRAMENRLIPGAGYPLRNITVTGFSRSIKPRDIKHNIGTVKNLSVAKRECGEILDSFKPDIAVGTGGYVCYPILKAAAKLVRVGKLSLSQELEVPEEVILPDTRVFDRGVSRYTLEELLYWMITVSDNTATNVVLDTVGLDFVTNYCASLGLKNTLCRRKMLDFAAAKAGRDNVTTALDQRRLYWLLQTERILTPELCRTAMDILCRQRSMDCVLRYVPDRVTFAHKTGGLDGVCHDSGLFLAPMGPLYVGIFTWEGPDLDGDPVQSQKKFIGRLGKAVFDTYKGEVK